MRLRGDVAQMNFDIYILLASSARGGCAQRLLLASVVVEWRWFRTARMSSRAHKQSMSELKLRRLTEHNQRLRDDLARPRIRVSEASASLIRYCKTTKDHLVRRLLYALSPTILTSNYRCQVCGARLGRARTRTRPRRTSKVAPASSCNPPRPSLSTQTTSQPARPAHHAQTHKHAHLSHPPPLGTRQYHNLSPVTRHALRPRTSCCPRFLTPAFLRPSRLLSFMLFIIFPFHTCACVPFAVPLFILTSPASSLLQPLLARVSSASHLRFRNQSDRIPNTSSCLISRPRFCSFAVSLQCSTCTCVHSPRASRSM